MSLIFLSRFDSTNVGKMCLKNSEAASTLGRQDLARVWSLAAQVATEATRDDDEDDAWHVHPVSFGVIRSL